MSYLLDGGVIRSPMSIEESNLTQYAQQKALSGAVGRDYFGSNKRVWTLEYNNTKKAAFDVINTIYQTYLSTGTARTFASTETNYTVSSTSVHMDLQVVNFSVSGTDYIRDFVVVLTEV